MPSTSPGTSPLGHPPHAPRRRRRSGCARRPYSTPSRTSVALMNTVTGWPSARPRRSAEERVIAETICWPSTSTTTSAITAPSSTLRTVPLSWLRALSCTLTSGDGVLARWPSLLAPFGSSCGSGGVDGHFGGLDAGPHLAAVGQAELGGGRGRDLSHDRDRAGHLDADTVANHLHGTCGAGPHVAGGALGDAAVQRDGVGMHRSEHLTVVDVGRDHGATADQPDTSAVGQAPVQVDPDQLGDIAGARVLADLGRGAGLSDRALLQDDQP